MNISRVIPLDVAPNLQALMAAYPALFPALLQSSKVEGWDMLFASTETIPVVGGQHVLETLNSQWQQRGGVVPQWPAGVPELPFKGGWFVYCGYELLHDIEPVVPRFAESSDFPPHALFRVPAAILVNRQTGASWLVAEPDFEVLAERIMGLLAESVTPVSATVQGVEEITEEAPDIYLRNILKVKSYITEGDVFQVNLSRRWTARLNQDFSPHTLYARLREVNPAPFSGLVRIPQPDQAPAWIISASPERLIKVGLEGTERKAETRPIAGTHPRSLDLAEDERLKQQLLASRKERAEHIMLVDLERNDLGRVCKPGTVKVDELMAVATYAFVHHIESNVNGYLRDEVLPGDAIKAMFPGGTITGCPKVRTMQIIRELETHPRYAYTGSMGYVNLDGSMDMNILIRSFMYNPALPGEELVFRAGGGIVIDSDPERELNETRAKVKGLMRALRDESSVTG
ncbi:aminodeoxychorismate synthase component I [Leeia oryzae]|uniref:aminodeoxychorismate synthase component I n=1 Tax=Leeia oryzae TaxID=356662 RepID=UPI00039AB967|nr:aminodeoxychorismate synthase component I [Leeia oryzae]